MKALYASRGVFAALFFSFFIFQTQSFAQKTQPEKGSSSEITTPDSPKKGSSANVKNATPMSATPIDSSKWFEKTQSIGLSFGLKALVGADFAMRFTKNWAVRVGLNYNRFEIERQDVLIIGEKNRYDITAFSHLSNLEALGEWTPFHRKSGFRIIAGGVFFFKNEIGGRGGISNNTVLNDVEVTPAEIGDGQLTVDWKSPLSAYAGLAFGRLVPKKRLNLSVEMGGYLKGAPRFDIEATQLLTENERNEPILNENFKGQKFWPNFSFRIGYRLK